MITVNPNNPSSGQNIELVVSGAACVNSTSQSINGSEFQFTVDSSGNCFSPPPGYSYSWDLGSLAEGNYTASHYESVDGGPAVLIESEQFSVAAGINTQAVPVMPSLALALLSFAIVSVVSRRLKLRSK